MLGQVIVALRANRFGMLLNFYLYRLVNLDSMHHYTYVGVSNLTSRIISIHEAGIEIAERAETLFFETDYAKTSHTLHCDLGKIDKLVKAYIGPLEYGMLVRFNEEQHITLTYHSPTNERAKDYDIFLGYPDSRAEQLIEKIYPFMEILKESALQHG